MSSISLNGKLHKGTGNTPVVFVLGEDRNRLTEWWAEKGIFTHLFKQVSPEDGASSPLIYVTNNIVASVQDGDEVVITIDERMEKRGNGIRTLSVIQRG